MKGPTGGTLGLHARLVIWLLVMLAVTWLLIWGNTRSIIDNIVNQDLDRRLQSTASMLLQLYVADALSAGDTVIEPASNAVGGSPHYLIQTKDGVELVRSSSFPVAARESGPGFSNRIVGPKSWRLFTLPDDQHQVTVITALPHSIGEAYAGELNRDFDGPLHWLIPVLVVMAFFSVWRGLAPLRGIERAVASLDPVDPRPLDVDRRGAPSELHQLIITLNHLIGRMREVLVRQRVFTAGAGHELRTPLAGCKTQLHVASQSADATRRQKALQQASVSVDHMEALLKQLLFFARLDPAAPPIEQNYFQLGALVRRVSASLSAQIDRAGVLFLFQDEIGQTRIYGNAVLVEAMISNLLTNAIRFSPKGGEVRLTVRHDGDVVRLDVQDQGKGLSEGQRQSVFQPFYKGDGQAGRGSGLGLAIVDAVARAHGGTVVAMSPEDSGTEFRVCLPQTRSRSSKR